MHFLPLSGEAENGQKTDSMDLWESSKTLEGKRWGTEPYALA